jgi:hypothetical protein
MSIPAGAACAVTVETRLQPGAFCHLSRSYFPTEQRGPGSWLSPPQGLPGLRGLPGSSFLAPGLIPFQGLCGVTSQNRNHPLTPPSTPVPLNWNSTYLYVLDVP